MKTPHCFRTFLLSAGPLFFLLSFFSPVIPALAQTKDVRMQWTEKPFEHKVFIENKGQFSLPEINPVTDHALLYGAASTGVGIYFTAHGVTWTRVDKPEARKEQETESKEVRSHVVHLEWTGANPQSELVAEDLVNFPFTYSNPKAVSDQAKGINARAFRKLIFKNLYDHIDVEYTFPENKDGIKYALILHPGADLSKVKMNYSGAGELNLNSDHDLCVHTPFGIILDHAPQSFDQDRQALPSLFVIHDHTVSFSLTGVDGKSLNRTGPGQTIVIDPWTVNPAFPGFNSAYDVDYDNQGNVYIYGGQGGPTFQFEEMMFNSAGVPQWVYTANPYRQQCYGDFVVDHQSGSSYLAEGYNPTGPRLIKVNAAGAPVSTYPGNPAIQEFWRISMNPCTKRLTIGGGGNVTYQGFLIDTTFSGATPVNIFATGTTNNDIVSLACDNGGNTYVTTAGGSFSNELFRLPSSSLAPYVYSVNNNYSFTEANSVNYVNNSSNWVCNAMNGMALSGQYLYTYDGALLQRWNPLTGTVFNSVQVTATSYTWGGVAADACNRIFVGTQNSVIQYDTSFNVVATFPTSGPVYDVALGKNNLLYACGNGFVASFQLSGTACSGATSITATGSVSGSCSAGSSATVLVSGGTAPFTYSWNPGGYTTQTVHPIPPGTYTVSVKDASCTPINTTTTVIVTANNPAVSIASQTDLLCNGGSTGSVTLSVSGGTAPYTFSWSPSGGTAITASGLAAGTYTCTVTDAGGCVQTKTATITQPSAITASSTSVSTPCGFSTGSATATASGGTGSFAYSWSPSGGNTAHASNLAAGVYTCTVTDANGCTQITSVAVNSTGGPTVTLLAQTNPLCNGNSTGTATMAASGGTVPYTYSWSPSGGNAATASGLAAGMYTCFITDAGGCLKSQTISITQPAVLNLSMSTQALCGKNNGQASASPSGGSPAYTYSWTPSGATTASISGLPSGTYSCTLTDANGCTKTAGITVQSDTNTLATISHDTAISYGNNVPLQVNGNGTYSWTPSGSLSCSSCPNPIATPTSTTQYCAVVLDNFGCRDTVCVKVIVDSECGTLFIPNIFTPNGDGDNDYFVIQASGMNMFTIDIFDRWGVKLFHSDYPLTYWDGRDLTGIKVTSGVYFYVLKAACGNTSYDKRGTIELLR